MVTTGIFALAVPSALGNGAVSALTRLPGIGLDFLTLMDTIWNNFALPIGGLLTAVFVGHVWRVDRALEELCADEAWFPAAPLWGALIRWVCPIAIASIIVATIVSMV